MSSVCPAGLPDDAKLPVGDLPLPHAGHVPVAEQHLGGVRQVRREEAPGAAPSRPARGRAARAGQGGGEGRERQASAWSRASGASEVCVRVGEREMAAVLWFPVPVLPSPSPCSGGRACWGLAASALRPPGPDLSEPGAERGPGRSLPLHWAAWSGFAVPTAGPRPPGGTALSSCPSVRAAGCDGHGGAWVSPLPLCPSQPRLFTALPIHPRQPPGTHPQVQIVKKKN